MFQLWRELVPHLGVGFTQREILLWAFTPEFVESRPEECAEVEAELAANPQDPDGVPGAAGGDRDARHARPAGRDHVPGADADRRAGPDHLPVAVPADARRAAPLDVGEVPGGHACLWELPDAFNEAVLGCLAAT